MHSHLLPAREKHKFQRITADMLCIQVFEACEACLQVIPIGACQITIEIYKSSIEENM